MKTKQWVAAKEKWLDRFQILIELGVLDSIQWPTERVPCPPLEVIDMVVSQNFTTEALHKISYPYVYDSSNPYRLHALVERDLSELGSHFFGEEALYEEY